MSKDRFSRQQAGMPDAIFLHRVPGAGSAGTGQWRRGELRSALGFAGMLMRPFGFGVRRCRCSGQTIYVIEGACLALRRGGPLEEIRAGERVFFESEEDHWHGAAPTRLMTHLSIVEVDHEGNSAVWGVHVTDDEYQGNAR